MHKEVKDFIKKVKLKYPEKFKKAKVIELGSLNYNGTVRDFFEECEYIGIDWMKGDCVDVVCKAHEYKGNKVDVVITTEMLEHDKHADKSIENALKHLKNGGILIGTCANINREKHYEFTGENEHYENISKNRVIKWANGLKNTIEEDDNKQDIRFIIQK